MSGVVDAVDRLPGPLAAWGALYVVVSIVLPFVVSSSALEQFSLTLLFAIFGISVVISIGYSGQLVLSHAAFVGIGAYTFVKLTAGGLPSWASVVVATAFATAMAGLLGVTALRASGIYLGIITLAFTRLFNILLTLFPTALGGSAGLSSPQLNFGPIVGPIPRYVLGFWTAAIAFGIAFVAARRLLNSPYGWAFQSLHQENTVSESIGINTSLMRTFAFAITGAVAGFGGALYAPILGYISPTLFNLDVGVLIIMVAVVGGMVALEGSLVGGAFVIFVPDLLRDLQNYNKVIFGIILILFVIFLPGGVGGLLRDRVLPRVRRSIGRGPPAGGE